MMKQKPGDFSVPETHSISHSCASSSSETFHPSCRAGCLLPCTVVLVSWEIGSGPKPYPHRHAGVCRGTTEKAKLFVGEQSNWEAESFLLSPVEKQVTSGGIER